MMFATFPTTARAEMDLDCTDEEWDAFIKVVEALGEREIQQILERHKTGKPEPRPVAEVNPSMLYYWQHLMGGVDES
jgi:hypothetical protein